MTNVHSPRFGPVASTERIEILDLLRGLALFGIIASNMRAFSGPLMAYFDHTLMWQDPLNRAAQAAVDVFISGKFITLFSFLFGIGFAIQMDRAAARNLANRVFYLRRLGILALFGIAHMFLLWWGDVLLTYALMGFGLFLFRDSSQRKILMWSAGLYCWPWITAAAFTVAGMFTTIPPPVSTSPVELHRVLQVYSTGGYTAIFAERLKENATGLMFMIFWSPRVLGIFLFGLWVWRQGFIRSLPDRRDLLLRCLRWGLPIGLALNLAWVAVQEIWHPDPSGATPLGFLNGVIQGIGVPFLSLGYASLVGLVWSRPSWKPRLHPFSAVGRTALTNYLLQTVLCTTLYYGYGFGLFGKVGPLAGFLPTVAIYGAQVGASVLWLRRFNYGPMEWLWRTLTYGRYFSRSATIGSAEAALAARATQATATSTSGDGANTTGSLG